MKGKARLMLTVQSDSLPVKPEPSSPLHIQTTVMKDYKGQEQTCLWNTKKRPWSEQSTWISRAEYHDASWLLQDKKKKLENCNEKWIQDNKICCKWYEISLYLYKDLEEQCKVNTYFMVKRMQFILFSYIHGLLNFKHHQQVLVQSVKKTLSSCQHYPVKNQRNTRCILIDHFTGRNALKKKTKNLTFA